MPFLKKKLESGMLRSAVDDKKVPLTPMMEQYLSIRQRVAKENLLFYRMGDFYELFFEDAKKAAKALDISLTKRGKHLNQDIPMCGVPVSSSENYLCRLIKKGFRVAVCEQVEDPKETKKRGYKAVVKREIVRIVTPGTVTEENLLEAKSANYICALSREIKKNRPDIADHNQRQIQSSISSKKLEKPKKDSDFTEWGLAYADISTGEFVLTHLKASEVLSHLSALSPSEILISDSDFSEQVIQDFIEINGLMPISFPKVKFNAKSGYERLKNQTKSISVDAYGQFTKQEFEAVDALLDYLYITQAGSSIELCAPKQLRARNFMMIDPATRMSLEISQTQSGNREGSLFSCIDRTQTAAGSRLFLQYIKQPLLDIEKICQRQDMIQFFQEEETISKKIRQTFVENSIDIVRALSRVLFKRAGPRDLAALFTGLEMGQNINAFIAERPRINLPALLKRALVNLDLTQNSVLAELVRDLKNALSLDLPLAARDGGFIAACWRADLDEARKLRDESHQILKKLQSDYIKQTGIQNLKIKHNHVLGYFIEVTARHANPLMQSPFSETFIHRQTLVNNVRFSTVELGKLEARIINAAERALALEIELFNVFCERTKQNADAIRMAAEALAIIDVALSQAFWAEETGAVRPIVDHSLVFDIKEGRHPVVEAVLKQTGRKTFTANHAYLNGAGKEFEANYQSVKKEFDLFVDPIKPEQRPPSSSAYGKQNRLLFVTGPNMAGKSTYLRQNALMVILAQSGCFVPASYAHIGVVDRLFSRVGAADDLARGHSTFMAEMIETASILNQSTEKSFVILDEIGRGTATFDGLAIAWAVAEYLHDKNQCRAFFATHYHELTSLTQKLTSAANICLRAKEWNGELVFLHEVKEGSADRSYGIQVARLAGLPIEMIKRAERVLEQLEKQKSAQNKLRLNKLPLFEDKKQTLQPSRNEAIHTNYSDKQEKNQRELEEIRDDIKTTHNHSISQNQDVNHTENQIRNAFFTDRMLDQFALVLSNIDPDELTPKQALEMIYKLKNVYDQKLKTE